MDPAASTFLQVLDHLLVFNATANGVIPIPSLAEQSWCWHAVFLLASVACFVLLLVSRNLLPKQDTSSPDHMLDAYSLYMKYGYTVNVLASVSILCQYWQAGDSLIAAVTVACSVAWLVALLLIIFAEWPSIIHLGWAELMGVKEEMDIKNADPVRLALFGHAVVQLLGLWVLNFILEQLALLPAFVNGFRTVKDPAPTWLNAVICGLFLVPRFYAYAQMCWLFVASAMKAKFMPEWASWLLFAYFHFCVWPEYAKWPLLLFKAAWLPHSRFANLLIYELFIVQWVLIRRFVYSAAKDIQVRLPKDASGITSVARALVGLVFAYVWVAET